MRMLDINQPVIRKKSFFFFKKIWPLRLKKIKKTRSLVVPQFKRQDTHVIIINMNPISAIPLKALHLLLTFTSTIITKAY